ncbi:MAG: aminodeoxychorismate synthase component I [Litoreibacter sp.]
MSRSRVIFDGGPLDGGTAFLTPHRIIQATDPAEVPKALSLMEEAQSQGFWLAGYMSYELGYLFSQKLHRLLPNARTMPLLRFGVFSGPRPVDPNECFTADAELTLPTPDWDFETYAEAFEVIHDYIVAGDIYQANLTFGMTAQRRGSIDALYAKLRTRQKAQYGALVDLGGEVLLSRSPELFFSLDASGVLKARPMKGTVARADTPEQDAGNRRWLQNSAKNRAENLMIVDLLRNDLSRISEIGSVKVPKLFSIETYTTLHQMTSTITSQMRGGVTISEIFKALFPCGSITGAPKIRVMQILHSIENQPRDAYCGSIGWIAPDGSMSFNVAIRTLICSDAGEVRLNVGGGIVYDSNAKEEYAEALLKAKFASHL